MRYSRNIRKLYWRLKRERHAKLMAEMRNVYKILAENCEGKRLFGSSRRKWKNNIILKYILNS
jgi:hypothetical protein